MIAAGGPAGAIKALLQRLEATREAYVREIDEHQETIKLALGDRSAAYAETKGLAALHTEKVEQLHALREAVIRPFADGRSPAWSTASPAAGGNSANTRSPWWT